MSQNLRSEADEQLMQRIVTSWDLTAFEILYRRYSGRVYGLLRRLVPQQADAEDAHSQTFVAVFSGARTYRYPMPVRPWLFSIAVREARRVRRSRGRFPEPVEPDALPELAAALRSREDPHVLAERRELADEIDRAIRALPARMREVVLLRVRGEMQYAEIAGILGIKEATARWQMRQALIRIRQRLLRADRPL